MSKKLTASDVQRREFEREVKKQLIMLWSEVHAFDDAKALKRILRAYNIAEMKAALWEEQRGEDK